MADSKLTALTAITSTGGDEVVYIVDDPGGTPVSRKITVDNLRGSIAVRKTADESVTSSTTMQNDDALTLPVLASTVYTLEAYVPHNAGAAGDIKFGWSVPSGATMSWGVHGDGTAAVLGAADTHTVAGDGTDNVVTFTGTVVVGATAGNVVLQFAQVTSDATASTVLTNAHLRLTKVD